MCIVTAQELNCTTRRGFVARVLGGAVAGGVGAVLGDTRPAGALTLEQVTPTVVPAPALPPR